jgi:hypothetical protein
LVVLVEKEERKKKSSSAAGNFRGIADADADAEFAAGGPRPLSI